MIFAKYEQSVDFLRAELTPDFRLFGAHGVPEIPYSKLEELKESLVCIRNRKTGSDERLSCLSSWTQVKDLIAIPYWLSI